MRLNAITTHWWQEQAIDVGHFWPLLTPLTARMQRLSHMDILHQDQCQYRSYWKDLNYRGDASGVSLLTDKH
jgi:hypothetical protein